MSGNQIPKQDTSIVDLLIEAERLLQTAKAFEPMLRLHIQDHDPFNGKYMEDHAEAFPKGAFADYIRRREALFTRVADLRRPSPWVVRTPAEIQAAYPEVAGKEIQPWCAPCESGDHANHAPTFEWHGRQACLCPPCKGG